MQDLFDWFSHVQFGSKSNTTYSSCLICVSEKEKGEGKLWHACYKSSWWHLMAISDLGDEKRALLLLRLIHLTCLSWKKKIFFQSILIGITFMEEASQRLEQMCGSCSQNQAVTQCRRINLSQCYLADSMKTNQSIVSLDLIAL